MGELRPDVQPKLHERRHNSSPSAGSGVSARLTKSEAQLRQLLALCGASLVETTRVVRELSDRVTLLREAIEVLLTEGQLRPPWSE
jgi:hypothetical protein